MNPTSFTRLGGRAVIRVVGHRPTEQWPAFAGHDSPGRPRLLPLGLSGAYNWRGTVGKTVGPVGSRLDVRGVIPDQDRVGWQGRKVVIAYDADAVTVPARQAFAAPRQNQARAIAACAPFWRRIVAPGVDSNLG